MTAFSTLTVLRSVTDLGDAALLVPASALVLAYLLYCRMRRLALLWASAVALCAALTIAMKIGFTAFGTNLPLLGLRGLSGHASFGTMFYLCSALMMAGDKDRWCRATVLVAAASIAAAIAISRVILHAHSPDEVLGGVAIGIVSVGWFSLRYFAAPKPRLRWEPLLGMLVALAIGAHGRHLDIEPLIRRVSMMVRVPPSAGHPSVRFFCFGEAAQSATLTSRTEFLGVELPAGCSPGRPAVEPRDEKGPYRLVHASQAA